MSLIEKPCPVCRVPYLDGHLCHNPTCWVDSNPKPMDRREHLCNDCGTSRLEPEDSICLGCSIKRGQP
jgi:hypothetical protein